MAPSPGANSSVAPWPGQGSWQPWGRADVLFVEPRTVAIERVNIKLDRLPAAFHGFRIAQISDIHFGPYMGRAGVQRAVDIARKFRPDLVVLTGDFVSHPFRKPNRPQGATSPSLAPMF